MIYLKSFAIHAQYKKRIYGDDNNSFVVEDLPSLRRENAPLAQKYRESDMRKIDIRIIQANLGHLCFDLLQFVAPGHDALLMANLEVDLTPLEDVANLFHALEDSVSSDSNNSDKSDTGYLSCIHDPTGQGFKTEPMDDENGPPRNSTPNPPNQNPITSIINYVLPFRKTTEKFDDASLDKHDKDGYEL